MDKINQVNILGTPYTIEMSNRKEDSILENYDGYCDDSINLIRICEMEQDTDSLKDLSVYQKKVIRHELVHAFLNESGLKSNSEWARNEEIVDWIAIQLPKMFKVMKEIEVL